MKREWTWENTSTGAVLRMGNVPVGSVRMAMIRDDICLYEAMWIRVGLDGLALSIAHGLRPWNSLEGAKGLVEHALGLHEPEHDTPQRRAIGP